MKGITEKQIKKVIRECNDYDRADQIRAQALATLAAMEFHKRPDKQNKGWNIEANPKYDRIRNFLYRYIGQQDSISWFIENRENLQFPYGLGLSIMDLSLCHEFMEYRKEVI